jgi:hypothetical protein
MPPRCRGRRSSNTRNSYRVLKRIACGDQDSPRAICVGNSGGPHHEQGPWLLALRSRNTYDFPNIFEHFDGIMSCRECKREISSQAAGCPHCGIKVGSRGGTRTGFRVVLAIVTGLAALVSIGRSSQGTEIPANSSVATNTGNAANDHMLALPAAQQATALGRMVAERCVGVEAFYQGMVKGQAFWSVRCSSGEAYQIAINPDAAGSTRVLVCGNAPPLATECFKRF